LRMKASQFFSQFATFMQDENISNEDDTYEVQDMFISYIYRKKHLVHMLPILLSYIEMHQGISYLQETGDNPVVRLFYEPDELAQLDTLSIEWFNNKYKNNEMEREYYIYASGNQIFFNLLT